MAEFLPYLDLELDYMLALKALADNKDDYLASRSYLNPTKWNQAYTELMSRGITGITLNNGNYEIQHNGLDFTDPEGYYGDVAHYILSTLAGVTPRLKEEPKKLPIFDAKTFQDDFVKHLATKYYLGDTDLMAREWHLLDAPDKYGIRKTDNRRLRLVEALESYKESLLEGKYSFEGSPFSDLNNVKARIDKAIKALNSKNPSDDNEALNALGWGQDFWLKTGENDPYGDSGITALEARNAETAALLKLELEKIKAQKLKIRNNDLFFTRGSSKLVGRSPLELKTKYGTNDKLIQALLLYSLYDLNKLTPDEQSEIHGIYRHLAKDSISNELLKSLQSSSSGLYKGAPLGRFKKINGVDGFIWDSYTNLVILIRKRPLYEANKNLPRDLFAGIKTQKELEEEKNKAQQLYLNNTEWTADLTRELIGIAADVASVIDPEPFTAGGLALTGTGLRTYNRATDADGFTWSDAGHTILDTGLSLLGMIPVVGDAALAARVIGKLLKAAGWLGAAFAATSVPQAAKAAWNKVVNGQDMTVDDWRAIGNVLMGVTQARRIQLNRAAGNAVKNQGGTTTKEKVGEVEVKINGKTEKVEIDEASAKELQQAYKAAGSDLKATTEALRKSRKVREQLEAKKTSNGKPAYTKEQLDAIEAPQAASGSVRGKSPVLGLRDTRGIKITERSIQTSGTPVSELNLGPLAQMRLNAILKNTGWFNRGDFGWNMRGKASEQQSSGRMNRIWLNLKNPYKPKSQKQQEAPKQESVQLVVTQQPQQRTKRELLFDKATINRYKETILNKNNKPADLRFSKRNITDGEYNIGGELVTIKKEADGTFSLTSNSGKYELRKKSLNEIKEMVASIVKFLRKSVDLQGKVTKKSIKEIGKILQDLKRKGWLKQGGQINNIDTIIENFLKEQ